MWRPNCSCKGALAIDEESNGPDHPNCRDTPHQSSELARATNRHAEAEPLLQARARHRRGELWAGSSRGGDRSQQSRRLLRPQNALRGRAADRRALAIGEASYGPDHPELAIRLYNLAGLLHATNRLAEAEPSTGAHWPSTRRVMGRIIPGSRYASTISPDYSRDTDRLRRPNALQASRARAIDEASYGPDHPQLAIASTILPSCSTQGAALRKPSRSISERWPSTR